METVIAAFISAGAAILVCVLNGNSQNKKIIAEMEKHNAIQSCQIQELTKTVDKHNKVIERVYKLEKEDEVEKEQIKVINHRIKDLEGYHKK